MDHIFTILNLGVLLWLLAGVAPLWIGRAVARKQGTEMATWIRPFHMLWMTAGFALDTALLLYIELSRSAIEQTVEFFTMGPWLIVHILIATVLIFWYPMLIYSGGKVSAGKPMDFHRRIALIFFVLRILLWVTAVFAMAEKPD
jgi:hypothetical protein